MSIADQERRMAPTASKPIGAILAAESSSLWNRYISRMAPNTPRRSIAGLDRRYCGAMFEHAFAVANWSARAYAQNPDLVYVLMFGA